MKKIGFIDIQSQSDLFKPEAVHIFIQSGTAADFEKTVPFGPADALDDTETFYVSLPVNCLNFRIVHLPFSDKEKMKKVIPMELESLILESPERVAFDAVTLKSDEGGAEVLIVYVKKDLLQQIMGNLARVKIDPCVITSVDLGTAIGAAPDPHDPAFAEFLAKWLIDPPGQNEAERMEAMRQEILKPAINLRTGPFIYRKDAEKIRKMIRRTTVIALALALAIHANILLQAYTLKGEMASIRLEMHNLYKSLFPAETRIVDELYQMKSHMKELEIKKDALIGISLLKFLSELSKRKDLHVSYQNIQIEKGGLVKMRAEAIKMEDLAFVKTKLSEYLSDVSLTDIKPAVNGRVIFTVVAKDKG
jgi:type II secretory pathway component PulL